MKNYSFDFPEIISLLNNSRNIFIEEIPTVEAKGRWALHKGYYSVHTSKSKFEVLYIGSNATHDDIDAAARNCNFGETQVVYANSLDKRTRRYHEERLGQRSPEKFWSTKEYLRSFIRDELDVYLSQLQKLVPQYYINPPVQIPRGATKKQPLEEFLKSPRFENESTEGLSVLLGEPGQGKTYMSQYLVSKFAASPDLVPIYIASSQWRLMPHDQLGSLQKTIAHSFRHFDAPIAWAEGQEERFLRATLKADLFRVVFDGFDEYILRNGGQVTVGDALHELTELVRSTGARIVITSRTSFWKSNVSEDDSPTEIPKAIYAIRPFDPQQARRYFWNRFDGNRTLVDRATGIYRSLAKRDPEFIGRGFILRLVGDLVVGSPAGTNEAAGEGAGIGWLIEAFCKREVRRQELRLTRNQQLQLLETFAAEVAMGSAPNSESLEICTLEAAPDLTEDDLQECVEKMKSHPLLSKVPSNDRWEWSEEQVRQVFLARRLRRVVLDDQESGKLTNFLDEQRLSASEINDLGAMVVSLANGSNEQLKGKSFIARVVDRIVVATKPFRGARGSTDGQTLATVIALKWIDSDLPRRNASKRDRAKLLLDVFGGEYIAGVVFTGTIAAMDLSGFTFTDCRFDRVVWAGVEFDESTVFEACHFTSGIIENTVGMGLCVYRGCTWDSEAEAMVHAAQAREGKRKYSKEDLERDVGIIVKKFVNRSGFLRTVEARNLDRGVIRNSRFCEEVIEEIQSSVLEKHRISGVKEGGWNVRQEAKDAVQFYVDNGVMTGPLKDVIETLMRRLEVTGT